MCQSFDLAFSLYRQIMLSMLPTQVLTNKRTKSRDAMDNEKSDHRIRFFVRVPETEVDEGAVPPPQQQLPQMKDQHRSFAVDTATGTLGGFLKRKWKRGI